MKFRRIAVLTGSGISAESGIKTFRASDGLWEEHRVEDVATPDAFLRNPQLVHRFYNERRRQLKTVKPNAAHFALAELERSAEDDFLLITQNIDDLHERAGSLSLVHIHGELFKVRCTETGHVCYRESDISVEDRCDCCGESGRLRPHIVWFGEIPLEMEKIQHFLERCDLFLSIGTSGNVYPAAGFVGMARNAGAHCVELNLEPSAGNAFFQETHHGPATRIVPEYLRLLRGIEKRRPRDHQ